VCVVSGSAEPGGARNDAQKKERTAANVETRATAYVLSFTGRTRSRSNAVDCLRQRGTSLFLFIVFALASAKNDKQ
jgi:hypothetical protein